MRRVRMMAGGVLCTAMLLMGLSAPAVAAPQAGKPASTVSASAPVNLNTATVAELEALPGIGPAMANRIVEYRQKSGGFKKVEDLMNVTGIGEKNFLKLKSLIVVSPAKNAER